MNILKTIHSYLWELRHPVSKSRHLKDYEEIAEMFDVHIRRVYLLAHGRSSSCHTDNRVVDELIRRNIISI